MSIPQVNNFFWTFQLIATEACLEPSQNSEMERFAKKVNGF